MYDHNVWDTGVRGRSAIWSQSVLGESSGHANVPILSYEALSFKHNFWKAPYSSGYVVIKISWVLVKWAARSTHTVIIIILCGDIVSFSVKLFSVVRCVARPSTVLLSTEQGVSVLTTSFISTITTRAFRLSSVSAPWWSHQYCITDLRGATRHLSALLVQPNPQADISSASPCPTGLFRSLTSTIRIRIKGLL